jgi:AmmeMemoRadiSam system protein A
MPSLSEIDRQGLLTLARQAIASAVSHGQILAAVPREGIFSERHGIFVTLHIHQRLRGCIGVIESEEPLADAVVRCAVSAALQDPRFPPLRPDELPNIEIEISLLSAPAPIRPEDIQIGNHGLLITQGTHRGLLLPQVAVEHHLNAEQFLAETCRKAQLPPVSWRQPDTKIYAFTCMVFSDRPVSQGSPAPEEIPKPQS